MPTHEECRLRPITADDLDLVLQWRNSERVRCNMYTDHIISMAEHRAWFSRLAQNPATVYLVFECRDIPVGMVYFTDIDRCNGTCAWGFYLGEVDVPKGTGTIMGESGVAYAFTVLGIRKLCGEVFAFNDASLRFFQRLGFREEGCRVKHVLRDGIPQDIVLYARFKDEWQAQRYPVCLDGGAQ